MAVRSERRGDVAVVTIDRQPRRNAVDAEALEQVRAAVSEAAAEARVIVLTGAGGHFCAGADLTGVDGPDFAGRLRAVLDGLVGAPVPVVAAVEGVALGAGTQLAAACDLRMAAPDSRFGLPAAKLGLMVDHWSVRRLARLAGPGPAAAMLLAAETLDGAEAHRLGLVQRLGRLDDALAWAGEIARLAPLTLAGQKLMLNRLEPGDADDPDVSAAFARAWASEDLVEGMTAFRERRPPAFRGH